MITKAVIFSSAKNSLRDEVVLGHSLLARALIVAARAGVDEFLVVTEEGADELAASLDRNRVLSRQDCVVECLSLSKLKSESGLSQRLAEGFLLLSDTAVVQQELVKKLIERNPGKGRSLLLLDSDTRGLGECEGLLRIMLDQKSGKIGSAGYRLETWNAFWTGLALCPGKSFSTLVKAFEKDPLTGIDHDLLKIFPPQTSDFIYCVQDYALDVRSVELLAKAKRVLLKSVRKSTDGFIARHLNRPVSLFLSRGMIRLGFSPNFISGANLMVGVFASVLLALGGYLNGLIAGLLFQLTSIVDGSDGEVAKLTWKMSPKGAWIDTLCDQLTYLLFFVALPLGLYFDNTPLTSKGDEVYLALGGVTLVSLATMFWLMSRYVKRLRGAGSMLQIITDIEESSRQPGLASLIDRFVVKISFIFRRDFFAFATMLLLIAGLQAPLMWLIASLCLIQVFYLWLFSRRRFKRLGLSGR